MGKSNREYIQNVARDFMGHLKIRTAEYKHVAEMTTLAKVLYGTFAVDIIRMFIERRYTPETLGRIAWYGNGQMPQGDFQSLYIGNDVRPKGMETNLSQVLDHDIAKFHNGAYQLMQLAAATIVAEMVTLMHTKIMIASITGREPEEVDAAAE